MVVPVGNKSTDGTIALARHMRSTYYQSINTIGPGNQYNEGMMVSLARQSIQ